MKLTAKARFDAFHNQTARVLEALSASSGAFKYDAGETLLFTRQLMHIFARTFEVKRPDLKGRSVATINYEVPNWATEHTYRMFDKQGLASVSHIISNDLPTPELTGTETTNKVVSIMAAYGYDVQELRVAQGTGFNLPAQKALAARSMVETRLDQLIANGSPNNGLGGFLKDAANAHVGTLVTSTGTWNAAGNVDAEHASVIADVQKLVQSVWINTLGAHTANRVLVSNKAYSKLLASKLNQYSDLSLLQYLNQSLNVTIEPWLTLDGGVDATHDKLVAYQDSSENLEIIIPQEFEQFAPQQRGLRFEIPVHMRFGGVTIRYPKAISYMSVLNTSL